MFYLVLAFAVNVTVTMPKPFDTLAACQASGRENVALSQQMTASKEPASGGIDLRAWTCVKQ